jgi:hypothetical protein
VGNRGYFAINRDCRIRLSLHKGAPFAIWLGILLDGIPVSLVIGASMVQAQINYSLIGGLFLSNYPEALSSSIGMRQHGFPFRRILFMWTALMVITGIGAAFGIIPNSNQNRTISHEN